MTGNSKRNSASNRGESRQTDGIPDFLTVADVATKLQVRAQTIRQAISDGELPAVKFGTWRIDPADVEAWIESRKVTCIRSAKRVPLRHDKADETPFRAMARQVDGRDGLTSEQDIQRRAAS